MPQYVPGDKLFELVGTDLGESPWFRIEQARIDQFADATDDWQWIHVDQERAAEGTFGAPVAHGYLTRSLVPKPLGGILTVSDEVRGTNYGIEKLRITAPVLVGSQIKASAPSAASSVVLMVVSSTPSTSRCSSAGSSGR